MGESNGHAARALRRRRRPNVAGGRTRVYKVRVSPEEAGRLVARAEARSMTVPRLLAEAALSDTEPETAKQRHDALTELFAVQRLLSSIANNVNQVAKATNATGEAQPELPATVDGVLRVADRVDETMELFSFS